MNRAFRILILDDETARDAKAAILSNQPFDWGKKQCKAVEQLLAKNGNGNGSPNVEVFLSEKAQLLSTWSVFSKTEQKLNRTEDVRHFLTTLDVVVLDVGGIGSVRGPQSEEERLKRFNQAVGANFARLKKEVPTNRLAFNATHDGIEFFHVHFGDFSKNCLIAILTQFDGTPDSVVEAYLHPFTVLTTEEKIANGALTTVEITDRPHVVKFGKEPDSDAWLTDLILSHYDFFASGLSDATNRFHISFAASHDQPVMIVGESGTGKEGIAKFIHEQWKRRKLRENKDFGKKVGRFQVVNCGGLSEQMAQAELFGYLRGTFTGADEHRLGKVFLAAGIDPLGKAPLKGKSGERYKQAEADLIGLKAGLDALDKAPQEKRNETFLREVNPHLQSLFRPDGAASPSLMRLVGALEDAERKLRDAVEGRAANSDFYDRLLAKAGSLLKKPSDEEESGLDLEYAIDRPIGTLFLDEFAELPLSVQTLLLRFLQSGEVQPMGFSGRILGLKARIIVATSDSRVAEFAGKPITGDFRTPAELQRPLRIDLLHRVRFQEIRTEPITKDNVAYLLDGMIARKTGPTVKWDADAKRFLVAEIEKIIDPNAPSKPASTSGFTRRASFGHRRELNRVVNLVWEYAKTTGPRGVRDADLEAQPDGSFLAKKGLIQSLWSPAMIVSVAPAGTNVAPTLLNPEEPSRSHVDDVAGARKIFVNGLANLDKGVPLSGEWTWNNDVANNESLLEQHEAVNGIVKTVFSTYSGKESTVCEALEGPGFKGQPRGRDKFDKHFTAGKAKAALAKLRR